MVQATSLAELRGEFVWACQEPSDPDEATSGELKLFVGDRLIWGSGSNGVSWLWIDLLQGLAENWPALLYEPWPEPLHDAESIEQAIQRHEAGVRLTQMVGDIDESQLINELDQVYSWQERHSLARYMPGLIVPDVHICGDGDVVRLETAQYLGIAVREEAAAALSTLGEQIAARLIECGFADHPVVVGWRTRSVPAEDASAAHATGVEVEVLRHARGNLQEAEVWSNGDGFMAETVWITVARACRGCDRDILRTIFLELARLPSSDQRWEDCVVLAARGEQVAGADPASYALLVAAELRGLARLGPASPFGFDQLDHHLGVRCVLGRLGQNAPEVVAAHRPGHLPLVLINQSLMGFGWQRGARWAVLEALSGLLAAGVSGKPWVYVPSLGGFAQQHDRLALEFGAPVVALDEFAIEHPLPDLVRAAADYFGLPDAAIARQLMNGQALRRLSPLVNERVQALLGGIGIIEREHRHLREVPRAA